MAEPLHRLIKATEKLADVVRLVLEEAHTSENFQDFSNRLSGATVELIDRSKQLYLFPPGPPSASFNNFQAQLKYMMVLVGSAGKKLNAKQTEDLHSAIRIMGEEIEATFPGRVGLVDKKILEAGFAKKPVAIIEACHDLDKFVKDASSNLDEDLKEELLTTSGQILNNAEKLTYARTKAQKKVADFTFRNFEISLIWLIDAIDDGWKLGDAKGEIYEKIRDIGTIIQMDFQRKVDRRILNPGEPGPGWEMV